ncbi:MAG: DUF255 domain-containing protein [Planctomycetota bacterium]
MKTRSPIQLLTLLALTMTNAHTADADTDRNTNRLARESSPYLLQHAKNPVDWYPWGPEAFEAARQRGVPIFLSVGYSTCYWCHVMERESFEDPGVAAVMNELFVNVKVDREERPDVDDVYMKAVQMMTGSGGWPMSAWLTPPGAEGEDDPGLKPFFGGTYFPKEANFGRPGFTDLCKQISGAWTNQRARVVQTASRLTTGIRQDLSETPSPVRIGDEQLGQAIATLVQIFDDEHGGFGGAPKFPQPVYLEFLLDVRPAIGDQRTLDRVDLAIRKTLDAMAIGGMNDQVGGGFHRYSTDEKWLVPHFEKMLYDQAQLATLYARSYARTQDPHDKRILIETLDYVLKEMTHARGGFFSAQDAEVNAREGLNYLWTEQEIDEALSSGDAAFAKVLYGIDQGTNFRDPHHPEDGWKNVLFMPARADELAKRQGMSRDELLAWRDRINTKLYEVRARREQPGLDDKVIASWNGMMIGAFATGAIITGDLRYLDAAEKAARFVLDDMRTQGGDLLRVWRNGPGQTDAFFEDYANVIQGLVTLHRVSAASGRADLTFLDGAEALLKKAHQHFGDPSSIGAMFDTRAGRPDLIVRSRSTYDGAIPAPVSVMTHALLDLFDITSNRDYLVDAVALLGSVSGDLRESPVATINSTRALYRVMALDRALIEKWPEPAPPEEAEDAARSPVKILADRDRIELAHGTEQVLVLKLDIEPGVHVNAPEPGIDGMQGLDIRIMGGTGVEAIPAYPEPHAYLGQAPETQGQQLMVYEGAVTIPVTLRRTEAAWSGTPRLTVTYQPCDDRQCFKPVRTSLSVALIEK